MFIAFTGGLAVMSAPPAVAQPAMPNPVNMSGIPRVDPALPAGELTVRCLLGGFSEPAVGVEVKLLGGGDTALQTAVTDQAGRAYFKGLAPGTRVTAQVQLGGAPVRSQTIAVDARAGTRVLLVRGAGAPSTGPATAPATGAPGARPQPPADLPQPGVAFPSRAEPGTVLVGTLDFAKRAPAEGVEVTLTIKAPDGTAQTKKGTTDDGGRAVFRGLKDASIPQGATFIASATIVPGGTEHVSKPFVLGERGMTVFLAEGYPEGGPEVAPRPARAAAPSGPRIDPAVPAETFRVTLRDAKGTPVPNHAVEVSLQSMAGTARKFSGSSDANGVATIANVPFDASAVARVLTTYDGAPYATGLFNPSERSGVSVDFQLFEVTGDVGVIRGALQYQLEARENDTAVVRRSMGIMVDGDKAFWPKEPLKLGCPSGCRAFTVLSAAERWLHKRNEEDPFAFLSRPVPPGSFAELSTAWLETHDGSLEVEFTPPFGLREASAATAPGLRVVSGGKGPVTTPEHGGSISQVSLGEFAPGATLRFEADGFPVRNRVFRWLALALGAALSLGLVAGVVSRPFRSRLERLKAERDLLLERVDAAAEGPERDRAVAALDRIYRHIEAIESR